MTVARHPDSLDLDALRRGEGTPDARAHVDGCAICRAEIERLDALAAALAAPPPGVQVPAAQDQSLRTAARARAAQIRRRRRLLAAAPALAAAAALALFLGTRDRPPAGPVADVNADGVVDILDAFALARTLEAGGEMRPEWDFNRDRVVDGADVDWVARLAVAVPAPAREEGPP